jgi:hypothetical protein
MITTQELFPPEIQVQRDGRIRWRVTNTPCPALSLGGEARTLGFTARCAV